MYNFVISNVFAVFAAVVNCKLVIVKLFFC